MRRIPLWAPLGWTPLDVTMMTAQHRHRSRAVRGGTLLGGGGGVGDLLLAAGVERWVGVCTRRGFPMMRSNTIVQHRRQGDVREPPVGMMYGETRLALELSGVQRRRAPSTDHPASHGFLRRVPARVSKETGGSVVASRDRQEGGTIRSPEPVRMHPEGQRVRHAEHCRARGRERVPREGQA